MPALWCDLQHPGHNPFGAGLRTVVVFDLGHTTSSDWSSGPLPLGHHREISAEPALPERSACVMFWPKTYGEVTMQCFEYKVVPAPRRGEKTKGAKTTEDRFAHALTVMMNDLGREGWEYVRADTLPCDERVGLTGSKTTYQNMLVFRKTLEVVIPAAHPDLPIPSFPPRREIGVDGAPGDLAATLGPAQHPAGLTPPLGPAAKQNLAAE